MDRGCKLITNGTDNHLMLIDTMQSFNLPGKEAQNLLDTVGITVNKNVLPDDPRGPMDPSGIRIGTPAVTTRGAKEAEMIAIAEWIAQILKNPQDTNLHQLVKQEVEEFSLKLPVPGI